VLPVRVARTRLSALGIAPVQEAVELGVPPGVAVGEVPADGGGAVGAGDAVGCEADGVGAGAPPIPGAVQAPRRSNAANPAIPLHRPFNGTRDNLRSIAVPGAQPSMYSSAWPVIVTVENVALSIGVIHR